MKLIKKMLFVLVFVSLLTLTFACDVEHEHVYGEWVFTSVPTLEEAGKAKKVCLCKEEVTEEVAKLSDSEVWTVKETVDPTCDKDGKTVYTSVYGEVTVKIDKTGEHTYGDYVISVNPTLTKEGVLVRKCEVCDKKETKSLSKLSDTTVWTLKEQVEASCKEEGSATYTSVYGDVTITLEKTAHSFGAWTITNEPTMDEQGKAKHTCSCGRVEEESIPALSDKVWTLVTKVESTCEKEGSATYTSVYGNVTISLPKSDHVFGNYTILIEPTLENTGKAIHTCVYGETIQVNVPALFDKVWSIKENILPTCEKDGKTVYTSIYGDVTIVAAKSGHKYGDYVLTTNPSLVNTGVAYRVCSTCEHIDEVIVPYLTDASVWTVSTIVKETCANEGEYLYSSVYGNVTVYTNECDHSYGNWTIVEEPTLVVPGKASHTCIYGETETVLISNLSDEKVWKLSESKEATCAEEGKKVYTSVYGTVTVVLTKLNHNYSDWSITLKPSLEKEGSAERICSFGEKDEVILPVLSDTSVWKETVLVPVSCSKDGVTLYKSIYGEVKVVIPVSGHVYGSWQMTTLPTLEETGSAVRKCDCGVTDTAIVPALTDEVWKLNETIDATCIKEGKEVYTSIYGEVTITLNKIEHTFGAWSFTTTPSKDNTGKAVRSCTCGTKEEVEVAALNDTTVWTLENTIPATCTEEGKEIYKSIYGEVIVTLQKIDHEYGDWTIKINPTLTLEGTRERVCDCGDVDTEKVPALSDSVWKLITDEQPDCKKAGKQVYSSIYGEVTIELAKLNHSYGKWTIVTMPTETTKGLETRTCSSCQDVENRSISELTDKSIWTLTEEVPSTCKVNGTRKYNSAYGEVIVTLPLAEHKLASYTIIIDPTLTLEGKATGLCTVCDKDSEISIPSLSDEAWTLTKDIAPDYNNAGSKVYNSIYGEVTVTIKKLVAPYDNKTYYAFDHEIDDASDIFKTDEAYVWSSAVITLDENGCGSGAAYPFRGTYQFKMVDETTGKILIIETDNNGTKEYPAFVDFETGIIVRARFSTFDDALVFTPYGIDEVNSYASGWTNGMAIQYVYDGKEINIYIDDNNVYFGVSLKGVKLNDTDNKVVTIEGKETYIAQFLYAYAKDGSLIQALSNTGTDFVEADEYAGYYVQGGAKLFVSGNGILKYQENLTSAEIEGTYSIASGQKYTLDAYIDGSYYEITLLSAYKTFTTYKPMVEITYDSFGKVSEKKESYNKNIVAELYSPVCEDYVFRGWYFDAAKTSKVPADFKPTEDVTLYANWKNLVVINIIDEYNGDKTLRLAEGDVIGDYLPVNEIDLDRMIIFKGWYLDESYNDTLSEEIVLQTDDSGATIYAKWEILPEYYGTYYGSEVWGVSYGNKGGSKLVIDEYGNISGLRTGVITSYDKDTQKVEWYKTSNPNKKLSFYFDEETGIIAGIYNDENIGNDYYLFSRYTESTKGIANATYGIEVLKDPTSTYRGYYAQFVSIETKLGLKSLLLYNNHIYNNISIEDAFGETLTVSNLKDSKTLIVKDLDTNEIIISVASKGTSFVNKSNTVDLDTYYGIYTKGNETIKLDGAGTVTYGEKTGTYTLLSKDELKFELYLENSTEYYVLTLNGNSFTIVKPMIKVTFNSPEGFPQVSEKEYNQNITINGFDSPAEKEGYRFKGWYLDSEFNTEVAQSYKPTKDVTLYAKWVKLYKVNVYYGEKVLQKDVIVEDGDNFTPDSPIIDNGLLPVGFYLDSTFDTEFDSENPITSDTNIYVKAVAFTKDGILSSTINGGDEVFENKNKIYPWDAVVTEDGLNLTSTNKGIGNSTSTFIIELAKDSVISFDYLVSAENRYDYLLIKVKKAGASTYTNVEKFTSSTVLTGSYKIIGNEGDTYVFLFLKDSSGNKLDDKAEVNNLKFTDGFPESKVTYVYNDGNTANTTADATFNAKLTDELLANPTNTRDENLYKFDAWYLDADFTTKATTSYTVLEENVTLYAKWKEKVTVNFVTPEGATTVAPLQVWTFEAINVTTNKNDHKFRGWYLTSDFSGAACDLTQGVSESKTLYAKFEAMPEGSNFNLAKEVTVDATDNVATLTFTTTAEYTMYYIKLNVGVKGKYLIYCEDITQKGGSVSSYYPKYTVYDSNKELVGKNTFGSNTWIQLEVGTYYVLVHRASYGTDSTYSDCYGKFNNFIIGTYLHDEASEALDYSLGTDITLSGINKYETLVYKIIPTETNTYEFSVNTANWLRFEFYNNANLSSSILSKTATYNYKTGNVTTFTIDLEAGKTYYLKLSNNWSLNNKYTATFTSSVLSLRDSLANKTFSATYDLVCSRTYDVTTKLAFDNDGKVVLSSSSEDHDDYCYDYYNCSFAGTYTYVLEGTTLTMTYGSNVLVFTLDDANNPSKLTLASTTISSSVKGYFAVDTEFKK